MSAARATVGRRYAALVRAYTVRLDELRDKAKRGELGPEGADEMRHMSAVLYPVIERLGLDLMGLP